MKKHILLLILLLATVFTQAQYSILVNDLTPGTLSTRMSSSELNHVPNLILSGTIDARDFKTIRDQMPNISLLNIKDTKIEAYTGEEGTGNGDENNRIVVYPANTIPERALLSKENLQLLYLPESITSIGDEAFSGCSGLTWMIVPESVTSIGDGVFFHCSGLTSVTLPRSLTAISNNLFLGCSSLFSLNIYNSITKIGDNAFAGCSRLTWFILPESIYAIGEGAFSSCSGLTSFIIPHLVTVIQSGTFAGCTNLELVYIPPAVSSIGEGAFLNCSSLSLVSIPASVTAIGDSVFYGCSKLTSIAMHPETPVNLPSANVFNGVNKSICNLYVPGSSLDRYKAAEGWKDFLKIGTLLIDSPSQRFITEDKIWRNGSRVSCEPGVNGKLWNMAYKFKSDSIINDTIYKKLLVSTDESLEQWTVNSLWRETEENKVFHRPLHYGKEELWYDFSLKQGDTFNARSLIFKVDSVIIKEWGGKLRKHWYLNTYRTGIALNNYSTLWIEGLGRMEYFPHNISGAVGAESYLLCFTENGQMVYQNPEYNTCYYTSVKSIAKPSKDYKVYPNPVSNDLFIEGNFNEKEYILEFYSMKGELIKTECMEGGINLFRIDAGTLKSGSYILRVISAKGKYAEELIIKN